VDVAEIHNNRVPLFGASTNGNISKRTTHAFISYQN
jgi:hypothetical protein